MSGVEKAAERAASAARALVIILLVATSSFMVGYGANSEARVRLAEIEANPATFCMGEARDAVVDGAGSAWGWIEDAARDVGSWTSERANDLGQWVDSIRD